MNNTQQFLEEENERFYADSKEFGFSINKADWLKDHDTRLINFILGEVEREVEKKKENRKEAYREFGMREDEGEISACRDISTIISNLIVK